MLKLEQILKYKFANPKLLETALIHSSVNSNPAKNYERLEYIISKGIKIVEDNM